MGAADHDTKNILSSAVVDVQSQNPFSREEVNYHLTNVCIFAVIAKVAPGSSCKTTTARQEMTDHVIN